MQEKRIKLNENVFMELANILFVGERSKLKIEYCTGRETIRLSNEEGTNIFISSDIPSELVLKNIDLINKRIGTGTKVLNWLKEYARKEGFTDLKIESIVSEEMYLLCKKESLIFVPNFYLNKGNKYFGDSYFIINREEFTNKPPIS